jgi:hypothetical protein
MTRYHNAEGGFCLEAHTGSDQSNSNIAYLYKTYMKKERIHTLLKVIARILGNVIYSWHYNA